MITMAPTYFIQRSDPMDPASALTFFPEKGSDELHDALRVAFPHLSNLQARMRQAVIEFYLAEQEQEAFAQFSSPAVSDHTSPDYSSFDSMPLFANDMSFPNTPALSNEISPELFSFPLGSLPSDMPSLFPATPVSTQASLSTSPAPSSSQQPTVLTQEQLSTVWALPSRPDAKVHKRRCMTEEEKLAYKKKRLQGACNDCKRRRRKCQHNSQRQSQSQVSASASIDARRLPKDLTRHVEPQHLRGNRTIVLHDKPLPGWTSPSQGRHASASADLSLLYEPLQSQSSSSRVRQDRSVTNGHRTRSSGQPLLSEHRQLQPSSAVIQDGTTSSRTRSAGSRGLLASEALSLQTTRSVIQGHPAASKTNRASSSRSIISETPRSQRGSPVVQDRPAVNRTKSTARTHSLYHVQGLTIFVIDQSAISQPIMVNSYQSLPQRRHQSIDLAGLSHSSGPQHAARSQQHTQADKHLLSQSIQTSIGHTFQTRQTSPYIPGKQQSFRQPFIRKGEGLSRPAIEGTLTALCDLFIPQKYSSTTSSCLSRDTTLSSKLVTVSVG